MKHTMTHIFRALTGASLLLASALFFSCADSDGLHNLKVIDDSWNSSSNTFSGTVTNSSSDQAYVLAVTADALKSTGSVTGLKLDLTLISGGNDGGYPGVAVSAMNEWDSTGTYYEWHDFSAVGETFSYTATSDMIAKMLTNGVYLQMFGNSVIDVVITVNPAASSGTEQPVYNGTSVSVTGTPALFVSANAIPSGTVSLTISVTVTRTGITDWLSVYSDSSWSNETSMGIYNTDTSQTSFTTTVTDADVISAYTTGGIYIAGSGMSSADITVIAEVNVEVSDE